MDPPYLFNRWFSYKESETVRGLFQQNGPQLWLSSLWTSVTGTCPQSLSTACTLPQTILGYVGERDELPALRGTLFGERQWEPTGLQYSL